MKQPDRDWVIRTPKDLIKYGQGQLGALLEKGVLTRKEFLIIKRDLLKHKRTLKKAGMWDINIHKKIYKKNHEN